MLIVKNLDDKILYKIPRLYKLLALGSYIT